MTEKQEAPGYPPLDPRTTAGGKPRRQNRHDADGLRGVDLRTRSARRWRSLFHSFVGAATCPRTLTSENLCRRAATLTLALEDLDRKTAGGEEVDTDELVRLNNALDRLLERLGLAPGSTVQEPQPDPRAAVRRIIEEESAQHEEDND